METRWKQPHYAEQMARAASARESAKVTGRPESRRMAFPSSAFVPSIRTHEGQGNVLLLIAQHHTLGRDVAAEDTAEYVH